MATKNSERVGRVGQGRQVVIPREMLDLRAGDFVAFRKQANGVLVKPKRRVDRDDVLTPEESALIAKARREMREGKYLDLAQVEHELGRPRPSRRRKTA